MSMSMSSMQPKLVVGSIPLVSTVLVTPETEACNDFVPILKTESNELVDLTLSDEEVDQSKLELNLLEGFQRASQTSTELSTKAYKKETEKRTYYCKYCNCKFSNLQALGGHQNAHKHERSLEKNAMSAGVLKEIVSLLYPYRGLTRNPTYSLNKTLGVQMQSMIHKPYNHWLHGGFRNRYQEWPRATNLNQLQNGGFQEPVMSGLNGGFMPVGMTSQNTVRQHVADMVTRGNHPQGTSFLHNQQSEISEVDLSLKL